jgi:hypothetical protein
VIHLSPLSQYGWNETAGRYIDIGSGRFIPFQSIKAEMETAVSASQANNGALTERLVSGDLSLEEWRLGMEREIKIVNVASAALARGGWAQMSPADWGWVGSQVKAQYGYLRSFAAELASGAMPLNGRVVVRARLYATAARSIYENARRRWEQLDNGMLYERRVLGIAEHCHTHVELPGCVELAALGWQSIGSLPPIGATPCRTNCQCSYEFSIDGKG